MLTSVGCQSYKLLPQFGCCQDQPAWYPAIHHITAQTTYDSFSPVSPWQTSTHRPAYTQLIHRRLRPQTSSSTEQVSPMSYHALLPRMRREPLALPGKASTWQSNRSKEKSEQQKCEETSLHSRIAGSSRPRRPFTAPRAAKPLCTAQPKEN